MSWLKIQNYSAYFTYFNRFKYLENLFTELIGHITFFGPHFEKKCVYEAKLLLMFNDV